MNTLDILTYDFNIDDKRVLRKHRLQKLIKRVLDFFISLIAIILVSPILLIACFAIVCDSKGSPIYKQVRLGYKGKEFVAYKLRTMYVHSSDGNLAAPTEGDKRVTKVGKFLRKTSIDELPQLINVLIGNMSILGPRAVPPKEIDLRIDAMLNNNADYKEQFEKVMHIRTLIKPGISGMAQANGRSNLTVEEATGYDVYYVLNYSLWLDIKVFFKTIYIVLFKKGVN